MACGPQFAQVVFAVLYISQWHSRSVKTFFSFSFCSAARVRCAFVLVLFAMISARLPPARLLLPAHQLSLKWRIQILPFSFLPSMSVMWVQPFPFPFSSSWLRFIQRLTCCNKDGTIWLYYSGVDLPYWGNKGFLLGGGRLADWQWADVQNISFWALFSGCVILLFRWRKRRKRRCTKPVTRFWFGCFMFERIQILVVKLAVDFWRLGSTCFCTYCATLDLLVGVELFRANLNLQGIEVTWHLFQQLVLASHSIGWLRGWLLLTTCIMGTSLDASVSSVKNTIGILLTTSIIDSWQVVHWNRLCL